MTDIEGISTWMQNTWSHHSRVITQNQETVAMTPTAESKRIFKSETALKWRWTNVQCNVCFSWSGVYIDIYFFKYPVRWQKLLGSARSGSTALSYRNCVITLVGGWGLGIARAFTRCMIKKKYMCVCVHIYIYCKVSDRSQGRPEDSLFNSYDTKVSGRALLLSLDCSTLPLIRTLYCWVLSKEVSSTIFKVFGMTQPGIEPRSPGPLANILLTRPFIHIYIHV